MLFLGEATVSYPRPPHAGKVISQGGLYGLFFKCQSLFTFCGPLLCTRLLVFIIYNCSLIIQIVTVICLKLFLAWTVLCVSVIMPNEIV